MNPYARPFYCPSCKDTRVLTKTARAAKTDVTPCSDCGALTLEEYDRFKREAWLKNTKPPAICELDLTDIELAVYKRMKEQNPHASKLTVLSWLEGQRYDPAKDPEFLVEARAKFKEWRNR